MKFKVYQFKLSNADIDRINRGKDNDLLKTWHECTSGNAYTITRELETRYRLVATVIADDLEHAFALMNTWDEPHRIIQHTSAASMSVGDVVEDEAGVRWVCQSVGFIPLDKPQARYYPAVRREAGWMIEGMSISEMTAETFIRDLAARQVYLRFRYW